jgi:G:T-mismatch repair DNA endonuclease (very short patch repair protein)
MDVHEPETCSYNMSQIKSKDTKPKLQVRHCLHKHTNSYIFAYENLW